MVIHVGVYPEMEPVTRIIAFEWNNKNTIREMEIDKVWSSDIGKIDSMFEKIILEIKGCFETTNPLILGCVCICLDNDYGNDIRKKFIKSGIQHGFAKVGITDPESALLLETLIMFSYTPKNYDIFWVINDRLYPIIGYSVWQNVNGILCRMECFRDTVENVLPELNVKTLPNFIFYCFDNSNFNSIQKHFKNCPFYVFQTLESFMRGILAEAEILAGHENVLFLKVVKYIENLKVTLMGDELISINYPKKLPCNKFVIFYTNNGNNVLNFISEPSEETFSHNICLPSNKKFFLSLTIDENKIFSADIKLLSLLDETSDESQEILAEHYFIPKNINTILTTKDIGSGIIGIDLGTSRCCAAVNRKKMVETLALDNTGQRILPSYVAFDEMHEKCGQLVIDRMQNHAKSTVFDLKRILGKKYEDIRQHNSWPFKLLNKNSQKLKLNHHNNYQFQILQKNNIIIQCRSLKGILNMYPEEITAILLRHIKNKIEEFQGMKMAGAVLTVPSTFTDSQKDATRVAAVLAGWNGIHMLPEPIAATFAYFVDQKLPDNSTVLLFDLGGGTLDLCLFKIQNNNIEILSNSGDGNLGGRDFDNILFEYFKHKLDIECHLRLPKNRQHKLLLHCQKIKENLSFCLEDSFDVEDIDPSCEKFIPITREIFEYLVVELLDRIRICLECALNGIGLKPVQIDHVLHVGGGCKMPMIKTLLHNMFPQAEQWCDKNPDEIVAIGAAYYGIYLKLISDDAFFLNLIRRFKKNEYKYFERRHSV